MSNVKYKLSNFYIFQVGSDSEEPVIFHQHLKTMALDEEKDLDTSQESLQLSSLTKLENGFTSKNSLMDNDSDENPKSGDKSINPLPVSDSSAAKNQIKDTETGPLPIYDNDLAYELQQSGKTIGSSAVSSWFDIPKDNTVNKTTDSSNVSSWNDIPKENDAIKLEEGKMNNKRIVEKQRPLSENEKSDKQIKKRLEREKNRNEERELVTSILSPRGPLLSMQAIDNIDLGKYMQIDMNVSSLIYEEKNYKMII